MVWNIPLASLGQLPWYFSLPATCALHWQDTKRSRNILGCMYVSTAQQELKPRCEINIILILNPKHSTTPGTRKEMSSTPVKSEQLLKNLDLQLLLSKYSALIMNISSFGVWQFWKTESQMEEKKN